MVVIWWCFLLLGNPGFTGRVRGQASTEDFISIDCGITEGYNYTDDTTNIFYTSDAGFINTGTNHNVPKGYISTSYPSQLSTLRSFPDGARNCYYFKLSRPGLKYLIRASFLYGNYDGKNSVGNGKTIEFEIHVGVQPWRTMNIDNAYAPIVIEVITVLSGKYLWVCLENTGFGTPFISSLELRLMKSIMYPDAYGTKALNFFRRWDVGSQKEQPLRYPDDPYDRMWWPYTSHLWTNISTEEQVTNVNNEGYLFEVPSAVLKTAAVPADNGSNLNFSWTAQTNGKTRDLYYVVVHLAELQSFSPPKQRVFNTYLNEKQLFGGKPFDPVYLSAGYIYCDTPDRESHYTFTLIKAPGSDLPPILNAMEIYSVMDFSELETNADDVDAIMAIKTNYQVKRSWAGDPCVPSKYAWDGLLCNYSSQNPARITTLDLSSSGLTGEISSSLAKLTAITNLDLSNNSLTGEIPDFLGDLSSLRLLNLTGNQLTGSIPPALLSRSESGSLILSTTGNPNLCIDGDSCERKKKNIALIIVICLIVSMLLLLGIVLSMWRLRSRRHQGTFRKFTYKQLQNITKSFEKDIGEGGFGKVYLGKLENGNQVAVKLCAERSNHGTKQFQAEVKHLTRIHHRNLVTLVGYCMDGNHLGLVYEYMDEGSLEQHLSGKNGNAGSLSWCERLRIALEAAQGLEYLHMGCIPAIIHRDVKTGNILLSQNLEAKIADFGMSKEFYRDHQTHISTQNAAGTPGYLDPEYEETGQLSEKSDVYSFGVVLLELITGRRALVPSAGGSRINISISEWVNQRMEKEEDIASIVDTRLQGEYDVNSVQKVVKLAKDCTAEARSERVTMSEVVTQLRECLEAARRRAPGPNPEDPGTS